MTQPTAPTDPAGAPFESWPPAWHRGTIVGFDLETTGTDPRTARIVTAALVYCEPDGAVGAGSQGWLVDPGVPIPAAATAVHGIDDERARRDGVPAAVAVPEILRALDAVCAAGLPLVVFNAAYDLTLVAAAARRHDLPPVTAMPGWRRACIIDPLVLDRGVDRYRRGKRTLQVMAEHYRVQARDAHSAGGDAVAACDLARAIARAHPQVAGADGEALHAQQVEWSREWAVSFQAYLRSRGNATAVIDGTWPLRGR